MIWKKNFCSSLCSKKKFNLLIFFYIFWVFIVAIDSPNIKNKKGILIVHSTIFLFSFRYIRYGWQNFLFVKVNDPITTTTTTTTTTKTINPTSAILSFIISTSYYYYILMIVFGELSWFNFQKIFFLLWYDFMVPTNDTWHFLMMIPWIMTFSFLLISRHIHLLSTFFSHL